MSKERKNGLGFGMHEVQEVSGIAGDYGKCLLELKLVEGKENIYLYSRAVLLGKLRTSRWCMSTQLDLTSLSPILNTFLPMRTTRVMKAHEDSTVEEHRQTQVRW